MKFSFPLTELTKVSQLVLAAGSSVLLSCGLSLQAGSFSSDFNSGLPAGSVTNGVATISTSGGWTNSGCVQLTTTSAGPQGSFIIGDLDSGQPIYAFTAQFKAYVGGGTGADGFSFNLAADLPADGNFGEHGAGTGITVAFDSYSNDPAGGSDLAGIDIKANGFQIGTLPWPGLRQGAWVDVAVQWHPDGTLDVTYDGFHAYTNLATGLGSIGNYKIGFGSRTGNFNDNHFIDDVKIVTSTAESAFVDSYAPIGRQVRADVPVEIVLSDAYKTVASGFSKVNTNSIVLQLDGAAVQPTITQSTGPTGMELTTVRYQPSALLAAGSGHTVVITFLDDASAPQTTTWAYAFTVANYGTLDPALAADPALVSGNPGFALRISQIDEHAGNSISRAESQLANLLIDPATGQPYANQATLASYNESGVINYSHAGAQGNFATESAGSIPGLPGTGGGNTNAAIEIVTYLQLSPGLYQLGVNSSDGFRLTAAAAPDVFAPQQAVFNGVRTAADTTTIFAVAQGGFYPFRICYMVGGLDTVNPTADNPSIEFFAEDTAGVKHLINDIATTGSIPAFRPAQSRPYIRSVSPAPGGSGVPLGSAIEVVLVDGTITAQTGTIEMLVNSTAVTPAFSSSGSVTTVRYQPSSRFAPNSTNTVQIAFTDSASKRRTNSWQFVTENILTQLWQILPGSSTNATWAKWVTTGSTERGLAYNPKTGHVLLVSRASGAGTDGPGGLGIAILDGNTGLYLGKMDIGNIASTGVGTFKLSMIGVAEDGVIYACNLTTSATVNYQIYRWQNEAAAPQLVFDSLPLGGATRCGDDFRVRGSGAGTQIIASGNSAVTTVPIFTTLDGINFTGTALQVANLPANSVRLGLAFGCGNTFYGATTATPMQYVGFNSPRSTVASRLSAYTIADRLGAQDIGPIGIDIINQRLIANGTTGTTGNPHTMNLYDLPLDSAITNGPLDFKLFPSANGNFGTGSIDFTPDSSRVYTLDTGNGIIAFSLAPKLAPPAICSQPRNFVVAALGGVGFMDVGASGAPQTYQWRFNGTTIPNATNRTLDIYNLQQAQLGQYSVVISNAMGSVTSSNAYLDTLMTFTAQPASQVIPVSGSATLSVAVSGGLAPYSYQWMLNGAAIPGATASSLPVTGAHQEQAGAYVAVVTDSLGQSVTSQTGILTVGTIGTGTGLAGDYYNVPTFTAAPEDPFYGVPVLSRVDTTIDFDWSQGSPDPFIGLDYFTTRWHGQVQPLYSQPYTFYTTSDDGTRLWVNGQLLVNSWIQQAPTEHSGTIALEANKKYDLLMEFYELGGGAVARLSWASPNQVKEIVPMTQLYPGAAVPVQPALTSALSNGTNLVLNWSGTFVLESAPEAAGPWIGISTNAGPYTIDTSAQPRQFYRLLNRN